MIATNPPVIKISSRLTVQKSSGNNMILITKKLYNGQERVIHLTDTELREIVKTL